MLPAGIARRESRGAHSRPHDFPDARRRDFLKHSIIALGRRRAAAHERTGPMTKLAARREDLLMKMALKIWRSSAVTGEREQREYEVEAPE